MEYIARFIDWIEENRLWGFIIAIIVTGTFSLLYIYERRTQTPGILRQIENDLIDVRHQVLTNPKKARDDIVIVEITERAINIFRDSFGRWPWPRSVFALLLRYMNQADSVMVDVGFWEPSKTEVTPTQAKRIYRQLNILFKRTQSKKSSPIKPVYSRLKKQIKKLTSSEDRYLGLVTKQHGSVTHSMTFTGQPLNKQGKGIQKYTNLFDKYGYAVNANTKNYPLYTNATIPIRELIGRSHSVGHITYSPDPDGISRRFEPFIGLQSDPESEFNPKRPYIPILGLTAALPHYGIKPGENKVRLDPPTLHLGEAITVPVTDKGKILINYSGGPGTFKRIPIEVLLGKIVDKKGYSNTKFTRDYFKGKKVLIGATAAGLFDLRSTPFSAKQAGVSIHANILNMFYEEDFLRPIKTRHTLIAIALLTITIGAISTFLTPLIAFTLTLLLGILYTVLGFGLYNQNQLINLFTPLSAGLSCWMFITVYNLIFEQKKRRQVRNAFQHYLTASVMEEILKDPDKLELGGQRREISVLFADIAGFTTFSEGRTATEVAEVINYILTEMTDCIFRYEGVLDKYIGDEMVAEFGIIPVEPPEHARRAVYAAIDMRNRMEELRDEWRNEGHELLQLRIGVHTGKAATGNMGSEMLFDFTALGDNVNLGSRLEGANKQYGTLSMISESTYEITKDLIEVREIDRIIVKGKDEPVTVYELLGRDDSLSPEVAQLRDRFHEGLEQYRSMNWTKAIEIFKKLTEDYPDDGPSEVFLDRSQEFKENPPDSDWDGVYRLTKK